MTSGRLCGQGGKGTVSADTGATPRRGPHLEVRRDIGEIWRPVHTACWVGVGQANVVVVDTHVLAVHTLAEALAAMRTQGEPARGEPLDRAVRDSAQNALTSSVVDFDSLRSQFCERGDAVVDCLADARLDVGPLLDDASVECEFEIGRVLAYGINPAVSDKKALEFCWKLGRCEDSLGDVGDVLAGVRLPGDECLRGGRSELRQQELRLTVEPTS